MSLGTQIKQRRKALGLTQQELADKLNLSRSTVANWEIDRNYPDIKLLLSISKILDITLEELLTENDDLVERISSDTIVRKKQSRKINVLYCAVIVLCLILLATVFLSNGRDISGESHIASAQIDGNTLHIKTDLPFYKSTGGYFMNYTDSSRENLEISISAVFSMDHNEVLDIPLEEDELRDLRSISFSDTENTYKVLKVQNGRIVE